MVRCTAFRFSLYIGTHLLSVCGEPECQNQACILWSRVKLPASPSYTGYCHTHLRLPGTWWQTSFVTTAPSPPLATTPLRHSTRVPIIPNSQNCNTSNYSYNPGYFVYHTLYSSIYHPRGIMFSNRKGYHPVGCYTKPYTVLLRVNASRGATILQA